MTDLKLLPSMAHEMNSETLRRLAIIAKLNFEPVKDRMVVDLPHHSRPVLEEMEREVKRFLALVLFEPAAAHRIVVSEKIDALWHFFILHTREYRRFCAEVYGAYLNHVPILPHSKRELGPDYQRTKEMYQRYFGPPPAHLWGADDMICWGGCDERLPERQEDEILMMA